MMCLLYRQGFAKNKPIMRGVSGCIVSPIGAILPPAMKRRTQIILISAGAVLLLGSALYAFRDSLPFLQTQSAGNASGSVAIENATTEKPKQGLRRKTSWLGRVNRAKEFIELEYYSRATVELSEAIKDRPGVLEPYVLLGEAYIQTRDNAKLASLVQQIEQRFPGSLEPIVLKVRAFIAAEKYAQTLEILNGVKEELPPSLHFYRAVLLALQNDHKQAREILTQLSTVPVLEIDFEVTESGIEEHIDAEDEKTMLRPEMQTKVLDVLSAYEEFDVYHDAQSAHLLALIGKALAQNSESTLAKSFADRAIKEDTAYVDAWIVRGYANLLLGNTVEAVDDLKQAYNLDPIRPQTHYFLALALSANEQDDEASLFFEKALEHQFEFSDDVRWKLVTIFLERGKYDRVIDLYSDLLTPESDEQSFIQALHISIDVLQKPEKALEFADILYEENPQDPFAMNLRGWALIASNRLVEAEEILTDAQEIDPEYARTYLNLGTLAEVEEEYEEAKNFYKRAYELGRGNGQTVVANLAAERYNTLIQNQDRPESPAAPENPPSSP